MKPAAYIKIKYPIHKLKKNESVMDLLDLKPLRSIFDTTGDEESMFGLDPEFIMRYIVLMNSPGSPFITEFPHLGKRKTAVLSELGIEPNEKGKYEDKINYLTLNKIPTIVRKISIFRSLQKPVDFAIGLHAEEELHTLLAPTIPEDGVSSDDKPVAVLSQQERKVRRDLIETTRQQYEESVQRLTDFTASKVEQQDMQEFMAQTNLGTRYEQMLMSLPAPVMPHLQRADTLFPGVRN